MGKRRRRALLRGSRQALLALLLLAPLPARAEDPEPAEPAPAEAQEPGPAEAQEPAPADEQESAPADAQESAEPEAAPPRVPYQAVDPDDRRGRTIDPAELRTDMREPGFTSRTGELGEHPGGSRELRELSRPPGPLPHAKKEKVPGPLRLRRPPGEDPLRGAPLAVRLCEAEGDLTHARGQLVDAVAAYKRARRAEYPHGNAKALVVKRRELAGRRLGRAEAALDALLAEAAEQGVEFDPAECPKS